MLSQTPQERSIEALQLRVADIEKQKQMQSLELETPGQRVPDSLIISLIFLKRAFTFYGHMFVAGLNIPLQIWCITLTIIIPD